MLKYVPGCLLMAICIYLVFYFGYLTAGCFGSIAFMSAAIAIALVSIRR